MKHIKLTVAATVATLVLTLSMFAGSAQAFYPSQTSAAGVVNLELPDLNRFWTTAFRSWGWSHLWRNTGTGLHNPGPYSNYGSACGSTSSPPYVGNAAYCSNDFSIYADQTWLQWLLSRYQDGAPAMILAHEYGHHISHLQGRYVGKIPIERELNADCLAGMYFRWAVQYSRVLNDNDYLEARNLIWYELGGDPTGHGSRQLRLSWFVYGYDAYNINSCNAVFSY